jgi:hypothetical protein
MGRGEDVSDDDLVLCYWMRREEWVGFWARSCGGYEGHHLSHIAIVADVWKVRHHMRNNLEPRVLPIVEALVHGLDSVPPIGIPRDILVHALHSNLEACAAVGEHRAEVRLQAVLWPSLNRDPNALLPALLRIFDSLLNAVARVPRQGIVKVAYEKVPVLDGEGHEGSAHENKLDLVSAVAQLLQLLDAPLGLKVRVVPATKQCKAARQQGLGPQTSTPLARSNWALN